MHVLLETPRLLLRRLTMDDAPHLAALDADPEVMRYLNGGYPTPREVIEREILPAFIAYHQRHAALGYWAAVERGSGDFLGWFSLRPEGEPPVERAELGYRLRREAWGKGFATEGAEALVAHGFTAAGLLEIVATTYAAHAASRRVMEKAGLPFVRSFRFNPEGAGEPETYRTQPGVVFEGEDVEYAITRAEWESRLASGG